jgi:RNA polymerase subunit RPABC4/transcription elongation factor Spt4
MNSIKCPECQTETPSGVEFCPECGYPFEPVLAAVCPECGNQMPADIQQCPVCAQESLPPPGTAEASHAVEQAETILLASGAPEPHSDAPAGNTDIENIKNRLQDLEAAISRVYAGLQEIKAENAQKDSAASIVSEINKGTEAHLKPISAQLAALPDIARKLGNTGAPSDGSMPKSLKWLDYLFAVVLVMLFFVVINMLIAAYIVRIIPAK